MIYLVRVDSNWMKPRLGCSRNGKARTGRASRSTTRMVEGGRNGWSAGRSGGEGRDGDSGEVKVANWRGFFYHRRHYSLCPEAPVEPSSRRKASQEQAFQASKLQDKSAARQPACSIVSASFSRSRTGPRSIKEAGEVHDDLCTLSARSHLPCRSQCVVNMLLKCGTGNKVQWGVTESDRLG